MHLKIKLKEEDKRMCNTNPVHHITSFKYDKLSSISRNEKKKRWPKWAAHVGLICFELNLCTWIVLLSLEQSVGAMNLSYACCSLCSMEEESQREKKIAKMSESKRKKKKKIMTYLNRPGWRCKNGATN